MVLCETEGAQDQVSCERSFARKAALAANWILPPLGLGMSTMMSEVGIVNDQWHSPSISKITKS